MGTKTITMYVSDIDQSTIAAGEAYQLSIRHPDGSTQQLDISAKNYRDLKLEGLGKTLKKRGRKPGSGTANFVGNGRVHLLAPSPAIDRLKNSVISKVIVTNTLPISDDRMFDKIEVLSVAQIVADALDAVFEDTSVSEIFEGENQA